MVREACGWTAAEIRELASTGLPSPEELQILEPLKDQIPPEVFTKT